MNDRYRKLFIFDADGTLRRCTVAGQPCPNRAGEWEVIPGVKERLAQIDWTERHFAIASNQGGVAKGFLALNEAECLLVDLACELGVVGTTRHAPGSFADFLRRGVNVCSHASDAGCMCRKPKPGLLTRTMIANDVAPYYTLYVGDLPSDREAALLAGCDFAWAWDFFGKTRAEWVALLEAYGPDPAHRAALKE